LETNKTNFREILLRDIDAIFYVRISTDENNFTMDQLENHGITKQSVKEKLLSTYKGWLSETNGKVTGFVIADKASGEIWVIAVLPDYINQKIGSNLLLLAEKWLEDNNLKRFWLTTDTDKKLRAYSFYKKHGWNEFKTENGILFMEKIIT
jgi:ribosomal protein S18 acetylase RimI-like enzyme